MSEIADVLDEASELLNRYGGAAPSSWERNLQVLGTLMVVHQMWQGPEVTVGDLLRESAVFLRAAFRMGIESVDSLEVKSGS